MTPPAPGCPLCRSAQTTPLPCANILYHQCGQCRLIFLDARFHLPQNEEKAVYDLHQNHTADPAYRAFLARSLDQVTARIPPPARGLDFGCGPGPALAEMAREAGYHISLYDKFYAPGTAPLNQPYHFITCTEVAEHLAQPAHELERLWHLLEPDGILVIQTKRIPAHPPFADWFYRRDPTHIAFYENRTFAWLARKWDATLTLPRDDVAVLIKQREKNQ